MKFGRYLIHKNKEWRINNGERLNNGFVRIVSYDRSDLKNGFFTTKSDEYLNKHGFYCFKDIPKNEITEAYEIRTYAIYKGFEMGVLGIEDGVVRIIDGGNPPSDEQINRLLSWGFSEYWRERSWIDYDKYVSLDDPDLRLIEERRELDIGNL